MVGLWRKSRNCLLTSVTYFALITIMEALKAEIASKRKVIQDDPIDRPRKYMKRGDLERLREERELATRQVQTSPEDLPSIPTRVSTRSLFLTLYES
jgi:hypothetical protein